ncbi:Gfo/Idh/MocA family oxidoreductase [Microbacterium sp. SD291]|uniref:Gfo/Idh/MocA family protein n=1 Tax=Microbacterium sp. SD291 TaxID=2782007 RepID=UPI001A957A74|nr:Gfo/Idh/MocA family oxidoreductase [Microbacterium sp. SD291]MBO0981922.1 Gfo/Idh/MocA family oxidoreductase [Microbacterium sp. SD291]
MTDAGTTDAAARPIRAAVVGFGVSGRVFHSPFLAADPAYSLDVIVTGDPERAAAAAKRYPAASVVGSVDEMIAQADRLDLVVIGTPPATHADIAIAALDAGLDVVVDKPFTVTSAEGRALIAHAEQLGRRLTVFQNRRWDGDFRTVRDLLETGRLGAVRRFESRFEWYKPDVRASWKAEAAAAQGGGILFDLGTHLIDQAVRLFGPIAEARAELAVNRPGGVADDDAFVALRHESGTISHLWMNSLAAQFGPRFHVLGSESGYTSYGLDGQEAALAAGASPADDDYGVTPAERWGVFGVEGSLAPLPSLRGDYGVFYRALADSIRSGAPLPVDPADAVAVLELIERLHAETPLRRPEPTAINEGQR